MGGLDIPIAGVIFIGFLVAVFGSIIGGFVGFALGEQKQQRQAVKAGVAAWIANENGEPIFVYKIPPI